MTNAKPTMIDKLIGIKIRELRTFSGMKLDDFANKIRVSKQQIQKYESGTNRVSGSTLVLIAQALEIPISLLFEGVGAQEVVDTTKHKNRDWYAKVFSDLRQVPAIQQHILYELIRTMTMSKEELSQNQGGVN